MTKNDIIARIEQLLDEKGLPKNFLMTHADISTTVYQWKSNRDRDRSRTPSLKSIMKICDSLGISLAYFFAIDKKEEMSVRQMEIANKLLELSEDDLEAINQVIDRLIDKKDLE